MYAYVIHITVHYSSPSGEYRTVTWISALTDCNPKPPSLPQSDFLSSVMLTVYAHTNPAQKMTNQYIATI